MRHPAIGTGPASPAATSFDWQSPLAAERLPASAAPDSAPRHRSSKNPPGPERHHLGPRQRHVAGPLPARDLRLRLRVPRLRRRRLDGHLPGQQRAVATSSRPPSRFATRSTRTIATAPSPTSPNKAGVPGGTFGMGVAVGDYDNDGYADLFVTAYGGRMLYHNNGNGTFTDVTKAGRPRHPRLDDQRRVVRLRQRRQARSLRLQLRRVLGQGQRGLRRQQARSPLLLHPARLQADAEPAVHNNGDGTFTKTSTGTDIERAARQGARRGGDRHQRRRPDGPVRRQRHGPELPVRQSRQGASGKRSALAAEVAFSANGQPRSGMGVDAADFDQDGLQDLFVANVDQEMFSLYKNRGERDRSPTSPTPTASPRRRGCCRLGPEVLRLRQRRQPRSDARQRPPRRHDRAVLARR